jgi:hypothetical protein
MGYNRLMQPPAIVIPLHDPQGIFHPHLEQITPLLKTTFAQAIVNIPPTTRRAHPGFVHKFEADPFFECVEFAESPVGEHFRELYTFAARICPSEQVLHLCYIDRLAFALQTQYRQSFLAAMQAVTPEQTPLIFLRSSTAWDTHPRNYRDLESMVTRVGEWLFHKTIDFAWCHMAVQAGLLAEVLPQTRQSDISMVTEIVLGLIEQVKTQEVDWLAWEDPFILNCNPQTLKTERENDPSETHKRLTYIIPMMQLLHQSSHRKVSHVL